MPKGKIYFAYVVPLSFSGQSAASNMLIRGLTSRGWECECIPIYPLDRSIKNPIMRCGRFCLQMLITWWRMLSLICVSNALLHLNLGQSLPSFLRVGLPFVLLRICNRKLRTVTSLHGSVFMTWEPRRLVTKLFLGYLNSSQFITVLGDKQRNRLIELGVTQEKIWVVPNTCETSVLNERDIKRKQLNNDRISLLHLSLLIESKGYPEFLEALEILSATDLNIPVEAVLCGPMSFTSYCHRFTNEEEKASWIERRINKINTRAGSRVSVRWIRGAKGKAKQELLDEAQVFVFPSSFPVEAQPLVLLEAMGAGCVLLTSSVGEIPSTVDTSFAIVEDKLDGERIAEHVKGLAVAPDRRAELGVSAVRCLKQRYSVASHLDEWELLLASL